MNKTLVNNMHNYYLVTFYSLSIHVEDITGLKASQVVPENCFKLMHRQNITTVL